MRIKFNAKGALNTSSKSYANKIKHFNIKIFFGGFNYFDILKHLSHNYLIEVSQSYNYSDLKKGRKEHANPKSVYLLRK